MDAYELTNMASPKNGSPTTSPIEWTGSDASSNDSTKSADSDAANLAGRWNIFKVLK